MISDEAKKRIEELIDRDATSFRRCIQATAEFAYDLGWEECWNDLEATKDAVLEKNKRADRRKK